MDSIIAGLLILQTVATDDARLEPAHDQICAGSSGDADRLTIEQKASLVALGWFYDEEYKIYSYFT